MGGRLLRLKIPYNSEQAVRLAETVMRAVTEAGREESRELAKARGTFPLFQESTLDQELPQRNATVTTIAPTGTLSLLASCSSGVEPIFGYVYIRNIMDGTEMIEVNPILREVLEERGLYSDELMKRSLNKAAWKELRKFPRRSAGCLFPPMRSVRNFISVCSGFPAAYGQRGVQDREFLQQRHTGRGRGGL